MRTSYSRDAVYMIQCRLGLCVSSYFCYTAFPLARLIGVYELATAPFGYILQKVRCFIGAYFRS